MLLYRSNASASREICELLEESTEELSELSELEESDDDLDEEHIEESDHNSDTEQEGSDSESDNDNETLEYFIGKDKSTKWCKSVCTKTSKTKKKNIVKIFPSPAKCARNTETEVSVFF